MLPGLGWQSPIPQGAAPVPRTARAGGRECCQGRGAEVEGSLLGSQLQHAGSRCRSTVLQQQFNRVGKVEHGSVALPAVMRSGAGGPESFQVGTMPQAQQQVTSGQMHRGHMPPLVRAPCAAVGAAPKAACGACGHPPPSAGQGMSQGCACAGGPMGLPVSPSHRSLPKLPCSPSTTHGSRRQEGHTRGPRLLPPSPMWLLPSNLAVVATAPWALVGPAAAVSSPTSATPLCISHVLGGGAAWQVLPPTAVLCWSLEAGRGAGHEPTSLSLGWHVSLGVEMSSPVHREGLPCVRWMPDAAWSPPHRLCPSSAQDTGLSWVLAWPGLGRQPS